ncbi:hypothetical protein V6N12_024838 [Hibiscus sabdariffa]|uniref:Uncharacterized protein n=1 Tax=Hibiscus sabdariffa TaxID=183260 RepID=A0ABR2B9K1_9ROSI
MLESKGRHVVNGLALAHITHPILHEWIANSQSEIIVPDPYKLGSNYIISSIYRYQGFLFQLLVRFCFELSRDSHVFPFPVSILPYKWNRIISMVPATTSCCGLMFLLSMGRMRIELMDTVMEECTRTFSANVALRPTNISSKRLNIPELQNGLPDRDHFILPEPPL